MSYKPSGHPAISPYLVVKEPKLVIEFLETVFDGKLILEHKRADGSLMHAEVKIDDSVVMLGQASGGWQSQPSMIHIYVPDARATYEKALASGAKSQQEPTVSENDPEDKDLRGGFIGPAGNSWWVGTHRT